MSVRENIELYHPINLEEYARILREEFGSQPHPTQEGALLLDGLPLYVPKWFQDHVSILGFNEIPLPGLLIRTLVDHPELVPDKALIRWTQEQDVILECTLGQLRQKIREDPNGEAHPE